jgi:DnaK suppressor protein
MGTPGYLDFTRGPDKTPRPFFPGWTAFDERWPTSAHGRVTGVAPLNQKDLKRYRKMLEDSKSALLESAKKTLMEESNFDTDDLPDEIDLASSEYAQSMVFRLRDREKFLLKKIEKALMRIEDGTFGVCERCEEPIAAKRLEARPVTTLCIRCKEEQEKKEKSYG